jgi:hypothetical protein
VIKKLVGQVRNLARPVGGHSEDLMTTDKAGGQWLNGLVAAWLGEGRNIEP